MIKSYYTHNTRAYFKSDTSLPIKLTMLDVKIKLENTVNSPAMPVKRIKNAF